MNTTSTPSVEYQVPGYAWNNKYVTVGGASWYVFE